MANWANLVSDDRLDELVKPPHPATHSHALKLIESLTINADSVQARTLATILKRNANTEYLARFRLNMQSCEYNTQTDNELRRAFKSKLPVVTYEDVQPDIQRIANGDTSPILSSCPISEFLTSSGTSAGERKLMPSVHDEFQRRCLLYSFLTPIMNQFVPGLDQGKAMYLYFIKSETKTPGGLLARPVLTSYYKSSWFTERPYDPFNVITSPNATVLCADAYQSMYCQLLCGLLERNVVLRMGAVFASGFLRAISFLQNHWPEFCNDIRTAKLNASITDSDSRTAVQDILDAAGPNPTLADEIERICKSCTESGNWKGIIPMIWPRTKYIDVIVTGAMAQYIPTLDFYSNGLPLVCTMYASSECYFGVNLKPLSKPSDVSYTLIPNMAYFEFLPADDDLGNIPASARQLVDLVDVEVGKQYELVVTTYAGLYRYRVGDILRVTGFHNNAPQFQFVCRKNVALSIDSDKTDEETLHRAVEIACTKHINYSRVTGARSLWLIEYTSYADLSTIPGHYVLFWELQGIDHHLIPNITIALEEENNKLEQKAQFLDLKQIMEACCATIEENLDSVYRQGRKSSKSIGPLEIRLVKPGTFDYLMDFSLSRGASINQYKAPRCVKSPAIIELMNARVICTFSSQF